MITMAPKTSNTTTRTACYCLLAFAVLYLTISSSTTMTPPLMVVSAFQRQSKPTTSSTTSRRRTTAAMRIASTSTTLSLLHQSYYHGGDDPDNYLRFDSSVISRRRQQRRQILAPSNLRVCGNASVYPSSSSSVLHMSNKNSDGIEVATNDSVSATMIWRPKLRQIMAGIASLGVVETSYLTYTKLVAKSAPYCGTSGSCSDVLTGPYSYVPFTDIPLSALGLMAYITVVILALNPLVGTSRSLPNVDNGGVVVDDYDDDSVNRVLLTSVTTMMGTFSIFLMVILFGFLHQSCPYCIFSAGCSITLAQLAWIGGCLPESRTANDDETMTTTSSIDWGGSAAAGSFILSTVGAVVFFLSANLDVVSTKNDLFASSSSSSSTRTLLASTAPGVGKQQLFSPPPITTDSSDRAIKLADRLQTLDARMYGAYWCSHCFDQKQVLGKQAFSKLTYVECSKDGVDSQTKVCKSKEIPGYPTWEIQGKLYPGQQEIEELEELVENVLIVDRK